MNSRLRFTMFLIAGLHISYSSVAEKFTVNKSLDNASILFQEGKLTISTGKVYRQWLWTGTGFQTVSFKNLKSEKEWCGLKPIHTSDWNLPKRIDNKTKGELISVDCIKTDDEKFTETHLLFTALVPYDCGLDVKFLVRAYPEAPGIWTALEIKSNETFSTEGIPADIATYKSYGSNQPVKIARNEFIPVDFSKKN